MGSLVIERVLLRGPEAGSERVVRASGGLALHLGHEPRLLPLLSHVFANTPPPDLAAAAVEFTLNGAVYQWRAEFTMGQCELQNRSTGLAVTDPDVIARHLDRELGLEYNRRTASYLTPAPDAPAPACQPAHVGEPPSCEKLAEELARYEDAMRKGMQAQNTANALYADLFPLLESLEEASDKLNARVRQLERHEEAEEALKQYREVEGRMQAKLDANRKAHQLEKQIAEMVKEEETKQRIPYDILEHAQQLEASVEESREVYNAAENTRREASAAISAVNPLRWWYAAGIGASISAAGYMLRVVNLNALWGVPVGALIVLVGVVVGTILSLRLIGMKKKYKVLKSESAAAHGELELAELAVMQHLRPHDAVNLVDLQGKYAKVEEWYAKFEGLQEELALLRRETGTDDDIHDESAGDSAVLAELQDRCRETSQYRLSDVDRQNVEKMIQDIEIEARYQEKAVAVLKSQCEELSEGWSDLSASVEKVAELRTRLAEWQRWEKAFQKIREVVDQLPDIQPEPEPVADVMAAEFLQRITAGRWTELRFDPNAGEFTLYDSQAGIWIHADRDNPAIHRTVDLAYRLSLLESGTIPIRLPLWLDEPFEELPESMAEGTAAVLADVARRRQVVLVCRQRPEVRWPEGAILQN